MAITKHWGTGSIGLYFGETAFLDFSYNHVVFEDGWQAWETRGLAMQLTITKLMAK